jgi:hypothetical protein
MIAAGPNLYVQTQCRLFHLVFLYQYSRSLEEGFYGGKKGEYLFCILLIMGLLDVSVD